MQFIFEHLNCKRLGDSITEMPSGFQIRVDKQLFGGNNLIPLVGIGLIELPNSVNGITVTYLKMGG